MRSQKEMLLALLAGLMVVGAPLAPALADRGRGLDDRQSDDRGGRSGDDRRNDDRGGGSGNSGNNNANNNGGNAGGGNTASELRFVARMRDAAGATARARYEERSRGGRALRQKFDVEIKFARPGEQFVVRVDGRIVGTVTANGFGFGKLELRRSPDDANEQPIPLDFPRLRAGAVVTVGSMQGSLTQGQ